MEGRILLGRFYATCGRKTACFRTIWEACKKKSSLVKKKLVKNVTIRILYPGDGGHQESMQSVSTANYSWAH